jgi:translation initiation factor IF-1
VRFELIPLDGEVADVLPLGMYRVRASWNEEPLLVLATISVRLRKKSVQFAVGARVTVEVSQLDPERGRITR